MLIQLDSADGYQDRNVMSLAAGDQVQRWCGELHHQCLIDRGLGVSEDEIIVKNRN